MTDTQAVRMVPVRATKKMIEAAHDEIHRAQQQGWYGLDPADIYEIMLAAAPSVQPDSWQDIGTAPKDGTDVDLFYPGFGRFTEANFEGRGWGRDEWRGTHTVRFYPSGSPTHWRPLPAPPAAPVAQKEEG